MSADPRHLAGSLSVKVPTVAALFWVIKILTTGMGEAASDYLARVSLALPVLVGGLGLAMTLTVQLRSERYRAVTYWSVVAALAVFGTVAADGLHSVLGLSLPLMTMLYAGLLAGVLRAWHRSQGTLSIHSITTRRAETWYWLTVFLTFALGTSAGDLTADTFGLGFLASAFLFGSAMLVPMALHRNRLLGEVAAFWSAYVLTRPMGASLADWMGKQSGLGLGDGTVTCAALGLIVVAVAYLALSHADAPASTDSPSTFLEAVAAQPSAQSDHDHQPSSSSPTASPWSVEHYGFEDSLEPEAPTSAVPQAPARAAAPRPATPATSRRSARQRAGLLAAGVVLGLSAASAGFAAAQTMSGDPGNGVSIASIDGGDHGHHGVGGRGR